MSVIHLAEAERRLRLYEQARFDAQLFAGDECLEWVRLVEDKEAWRHGYPSIEAFYLEHESRHPDIRFYAELRRQIDADRPLSRYSETIRVRLARMRDEGTANGRRAA